MERQKDVEWKECGRGQNCSVVHFSPVPLIGYPGEGEKTCEAKSSKVMTSLWF